MNSPFQPIVRMDNPVVFLDREALHDKLRSIFQQIRTDYDIVKYIITTS